MCSQRCVVVGAFLVRNEVPTSSSIIKGHFSLLVEFEVGIPSSLNSIGLGKRQKNIFNYCSCLVFTSLFPASVGPGVPVHLSALGLGGNEGE